MKFLLLLLLTALGHQLIAQCDGDRYLNFIFSETQSTTDILYGENINYQGAYEALYMDVYEPAGDPVANRPLVIMCHGGYFLTGDKAAADMLPLCTDLARMGYVVASINYRVGIPFGAELELPYGQALLRSIQDVRAAIRWFRKNADTEGNTYRINPEQIFVGGTSAGSYSKKHLSANPSSSHSYRNSCIHHPTVKIIKKATINDPNVTGHKGTGRWIEDHPIKAA